MSNQVAFQSSDPATVRRMLDEPSTVFIVLASDAGFDQAQLQKAFDTAAKVARANNPAVWRVLWVREPHRLSPELRQLFWKVGTDFGIVLSLGTGLIRRVNARYQPGELHDEIAPFAAFSEG